MANIDDSKRNYSDFIAGNKNVTPADVKFIERIIAPRMRFAFPEATNLLTGWHKGTNPLISTLVMLTQDLAYNEFAPSMLHKWGVPPGNGHTNV